MEAKRKRRGKITYFKRGREWPNPNHRFQNHVHNHQGIIDWVGMGRGWVGGIEGVGGEEWLGGRGDDLERRL